MIYIFFIILLVFHKMTKRSLIMKKNVLHKNNSRERIHYSKLWWGLALGAFLFTFSCKQANTGRGHEPTISDEIIITVSGDVGITVNTLNTIKVKKSSTWKDIKQKAIEKITTKEDKEIKEWRIKDAKGRVLKYTDVFEKDTIVFAVSKNKESPTPPAKPLTITIEIDEGYTFKDINKPCTIEVQKGSTWSSIKAKAETKIELKDGYEKTGWKLGSKDGGYLEDSIVFDKNVFIFATSKKKGELDKPKIIITVKGDEGVEFGSPDNFTVDSGSKWASIKTQVIVIAKPKQNFEIDTWHLNNADGTLINDEMEFKENITIFAVSKRKVVQYKVEHLKENIEDENYTKTEEEAKTGEAGKNTEAVAKQYEGFSCQGLAQEVIKVDGSTVVQIKYKRKITSLIIDLQGGSTTTKLIDEDGKKLLKGKFGARVEVENLTKENHNFEKWEPTLPQTFPKEDDSQTAYTAKWKELTIRIKILGDERIQVTEPQYIDVSIGNNKTFGDIKAEVFTKVSLKPEWPSDNYEIYDWRVSGEEGEKVINSTQITNGMTIYARTNYSRLQITCYTPETCKLERIEGDNPRGRIFIHENVVTIKNEVFRNCRKLTAVDFSACSKLKEISAYLFEDCDSLKTVNFRGCSELTKIREYAFRGCKALEGMIDLSSCTKLETIEQNAFASSDKLVVKLPKSITEIDFYAFSNFKFKCEKVLVPNETIRQLVIDSTYPEDRIELYH